MMNRCAFKHNIKILRDTITDLNIKILRDTVSRVLENYYFK